MAPPAVAAAAAGDGEGGQQRPAQGGGMGKTITGIIRIAVFWYFASKFFSPKRPASSEPSILISNIFQRSDPIDMWVYVSEQEKFSDFNNETALVWHETNIPYAVWGAESARSLSVKYHPSDAVKHNGTVYAHVFFARSGYPPDPKDPEYDHLSAFGKTHPLVVYLRKSRADKKRSLLGSSEDIGEDQQTISQVSLLAISYPYLVV